MIVAASIVGITNNDEKMVVTLNSSTTGQCLSKQAHTMMIKSTRSLPIQAKHQFLLWNELHARIRGSQRIPLLSPSLMGNRLH
jgi:hypothetical protein